MVKQGNRHRENAFVRKVETSSDPCVVNLRTWKDSAQIRASSAF